MQLKNNMKGPFRAVIRTNAKETVDVERADGSMAVKTALPKLKTIHIGQGATAEIDDDDWAQLWSVKGQFAKDIEEYTEEHHKLKGADDKVLTVKRKELITSVSKYIYREMVKKGAIEIVVKPVPKANEKEMVAEISKAIGTEFKPKNPEHLLEMYEKVVG